MAKTIWKFPFTIEEAAKDGGVGIEMPAGAVILKAGVQWDLHHEGHPMIWALVDPDKFAKELKEIKVYGTGWDIARPDLLRYLDTLQIASFVWHVFERLN